MIRHSTSFYCRRCGHTRRFTKRGLNHRPHRLATLLTLGSWGIVWLFLAQRDQRRSWRCSICRGRQSPMEEPAATTEAPASRTPLAAIPLAPRR